MTAVFAYLLVFAGSLLVDCIPIFAPPAWMLMMLVMLKFDLNPWVTVTIGNFGTVAGRIIYASFIVPWIGKRAIGKSKQKDLEFVGGKLSGRGWSVFIFVFLYALLPLSTTALFTAVGLAKVKLKYVIPPFFLGHMIGDGIILVSGRYAIHNFSDMYKGSLEPKSIILMAMGLATMLFFLFIDWRKLLQSKKLRLKWEFWD